MANTKTQYKWPLTTEKLPAFTLENLDYWKKYLTDSFCMREFVRLPKLNKKIRVARLLDEMMTGKKIVMKKNAVRDSINRSKKGL
jgi:uncharacterized protein YerC